MRRSSLLAVAAAGLMFAAGSSRAHTAKPINFKGHGAGSFINTTFTFDVGPDIIATQTGYDTLSGRNFHRLSLSPMTAGILARPPTKP